MDNSMQISISTITLWNYLALIVNVLAFAILLVKANKTIPLRAFFRVQLTMIIWLLGKILKTVSPGVDLRWFFIVFYYFGIVFLGATFLDFGYAYNKRRWMPVVPRIAIYLITTIDFIVVATNPYHYLFYSRYDFDGDEFGPLFYVHLVMNYLFVLIGMVYCVKRFRMQTKENAMKSRPGIGFAIIAPLIFNLIYISRTLEALFDYLHIQVFDITPIIYTWSILVFVYATFRFSFFAVTPLMKNEIMKKLHTPLVITDEKFQVLYANRRFMNEFKNPKNAILQFLRAGQDVMEYQNRYYICSLDEVKNSGYAKYIFTVNDVTSYQHTNDLMVSENKKLEEANLQLEEQIHLLKETSHIGARNYVARELHDIIGHSLVVSMKLVEICRISLENNQEKALQSLESAKEVLITGLLDIKAIRENKGGALFNSDALKREIESMLCTVDHSGMHTNFFVRGKSNQMNEKTFNVLKKVSMEFVTNTLKHADASKLLLSLVFDEEQIELYYMDNGRGTDLLKKGNGLNGIEARLKPIHGEVNYMTSVGNGFSARIKIRVI